MSRDALVIGINAYSYDRLPNLQAPAADAEAIAQLLEQYGEFKVTRLPAVQDKQNSTIRVGRKTQVALAQLEEAIVQLFKPEGRQVPDAALLYFSGHGLRKNRGIQEGFLATSDANPEAGNWGVSLQWLRRLLQESPVRQQIVMLDCCYSGEVLNIAEADPGERGKGRDRCFIAASRAFEVAYEGIGGKRSVLTTALLEGLAPKQERWVSNYTLIDFLNQKQSAFPQRPIFANSGEPINLTRHWTAPVEEVVESRQGAICPYKGLTYFDCNEEDPKYFYGRTALTDVLLDEVRRGNFLAILGASGSGKSSVLRAGLLHQLKVGRRLSGSETWAIRIFTPGEHPLQSLALAFLDGARSAIERATQLKQAEELLAEGATGLRRLVQASAAPRVVLAIDQFEEAFTLCRDEGEREQFFACLLGIVGNPPQPPFKRGEQDEESREIPFLFPSKQGKPEEAPLAKGSLGGFSRDDGENQATSKLCIIVAMRADFFGKCLEREYSGLAQQIQQHLVTVAPMTQEELRQAIVEPAKRVELAVEPELVTQMLADVVGSPGSLPLLQYALLELWQRRGDKGLRLASYTQLGGVMGTLQKRATAVYEQFSEEEKAAAKHIFLSLTQLGEGTEDTRRRVLKQDLVTSRHWEGLIDAVVQKLADARLIVTQEVSSLEETPSQKSSDDRDLRKLPVEPPLVEVKGLSPLQYVASVRKFSNVILSQAKNLRDASLRYRSVQHDNDAIDVSDVPHLKSVLVDVAHEALIRHWLLLRQWLAADRDFRQWRERLRHTLRQWNASARDEGALFRGALLLEACRWIEERPDDLTLLERQFIEASLALQRRERLGRARLRRRVRWGLAGGLAGALVLVGVAMWQWQRAETGAIRDRLNSRISSAEKLLASDKLEALIESIRAARQLQQSRQIDPDIRMRAIAVLQQAVYGVREFNRLEGHDRSILAVSFSPDGQLLVSGSDDKTVKLWHRDGRLIETLTDHQERVRSVSFSPDEQRFASASYDGTVKVWRRDGTLLTTLDGHQGEVNRVSFSPDGQLLASAGADRTVKLWHPDGSLVETLQGHRSWVTDVRFSPDGQILASSSTDRTIKLWHREGRLLATLNGHQGAVNGLSFSADSQTLASASTDRTVKLWRRDGSLMKTLTGHRDRVWDVSFSPDGQTLASASADKAVKLWRPDGTLLATLQGHHASIYNISFSPDGQTIASASADESIRLWHRHRRQPDRLRGHEAAIGSIRYSPDGQILASASADKTVKLWHTDGTLLATLRGHRDGVSSLGFSPDGQILASGSADGTVKLWYPDGRLRQTLRGHRGSILGVSFSPDGQTIASTSADGTVKLWSLQGTVQATIVGHQEQVNQVSFSPDGQLLATASGDETIKLWHADGRLRNTLRGHQADVLGVSFSPDGKILASASTDGTVKLWSYHGKLLKTLKGHTNRVNRVSFSPEGQTLVSASEDGMVKLWSRSGTLLKTLVADEAGVVDVRFSPDGQMIAAASRGTVVLWNANLEALLTMSCTWMQDYLETNKTLPSSDRRLCYGEYKADDFR